MSKVKVLESRNNVLYKRTSNEFNEAPESRGGRKKNSRGQKPHARKRD